MRKLMIFTSHHILFGLLTSNSGELDEWSMCHVWGRRKMHTGFWWVNVKERVDVEDLGMDGTILK